MPYKSLTPMPYKGQSATPDSVMINVKELVNAAS